MSKRKIHSVLQETVEEEIPTKSVDLWHKINQKINVKPTSARKRRLAIRPVLRVAIILITGAVAFLLTAQGRSLAQEYLLQYLMMAESNFYPYPTEVFVIMTAKAELRATETPYDTEHPIATPTISPTFEPGTYMAATQTVLEIEEALGFDVLEPGWLPDGVGLGYASGASVDLENGIAYQYYDIHLETNGLSVKQYPVDLYLELPEIGPRSHVHIVDINGYPGEYISGVWASTERGRVWSSTRYVQQLRWEQDGMIFKLSFFGPPSYMTKQDLIDIAESMH